MKSHAKGSVKGKIASLFITILILLTIGAIGYSQLEGWTYTDSFYFTAATLTPGGYGDFIPSHTTSKLFSMAFSLAGIGLILYALAIIGSRFYASLPTTQHIQNSKKKEGHEEKEKIRTLKDFLRKYTKPSAGPYEKKEDELE